MSNLVQVDAKSARRRRAGLRLFGVGASTYKGPLARMWAAYSTLLITTRGRRTGKPHAVALTYLRTPEGFVVAAGAGPWSDWYLNALANPEVDVRIGARRFKAVVEPVSDPERWRELVSNLIPVWTRFAPPRTFRRLLKRFYSLDYDAEVRHALESQDATPVVVIRPI